MKFDNRDDADLGLPRLPQGIENSDKKMGRRRVANRRSNLRTIF